MLKKKNVFKIPLGRRMMCLMAKSPEIPLASGVGWLWQIWKECGATGNGQLHSLHGVVALPHTDILQPVLQPWFFVGRA